MESEDKGETAQNRIRKSNSFDKKKSGNSSSSVNRGTDRGKLRPPGSSGPNAALRSGNTNSNPVNSKKSKPAKKKMSEQKRLHLEKQRKLMEEINRLIAKVEAGELGDKFYLELEFNTILSSLINQHITSTEFEDSLKNILAKVKSIKPDPNNIMKLLNNNNGKNLMCIKQLMEEKKNLLLNYQINVQFYLEQIDDMIKELQTQLKKKYFDYKDTLIQIKEIFKPFNQRYKKELKKLIDKPSRQDSDSGEYSINISSDSDEESGSDSDEEDDESEDEEDQDEEDESDEGDEESENN